MTHVLLRGAQASQNEGLHEDQRRLTMRRVLGEALARKRRVDQVNRPQRILSHDQVTIHGLVKDPNEDFTHQPRMIMQVGGASARHLATQPHTGLDVVAARHLQVPNEYRGAGA